MSRFWNFKNYKNGVAELQLYGPISECSWWGDEITPKQFAEDLKNLGDLNEINVRINSGGGDVFAGQTIYALLKSHKATVNCYIDGLAASIASIIAMAGDNIYMHAGSMMMIHNPWSSVWGGDAEDFRQTADILDKIRDALVSVYQAKTGKSEEELKDLMDAETWMTAKEAVSMGFATKVIEEKIVASSIKDNKLCIAGQQFDLNRYRNQPNLPKSKEGVKSMTLEEILAKLPDDEKEILKNHITTSVSNAVSEKEVSLQTEKALVEKKNSELKAELDALKNVQKPNQEDILASVSPEIKAMLESANKKALEAEAALQKIQDEKELECFVNKAKAFDKLPINAEEFGPVFKTFAKADKEGFEKLEALLKAANNVIDAGALFATNGTTKGNEGANAWETIQNKANALVKDGKVKTFADALSVVMKEEPDLYNQYLHEMQGDSVITE